MPTFEDMARISKPVDNPTDEDIHRLYELVGRLGGGPPPGLRITERGSIAQIVSSLTYIARHPDAAYAFMKLIDGDPRPGGSLIMGARVHAFTQLREGGIFYEPLSGYDGILRALRLWPLVDDGTRAASDALDLVNIHLDVFAGSANPAGGVLPLPNPGEKPGGHAVRVVGWRGNGDELRFVNSWGAGWGDKGFGFVSRQYLERHLRDAFALRVGDQGLSRAKLVVLSRGAPTPFTRLWRLPNGRRSRIVRVSGKPLRLVVSPNYSADSDAPADVLELRDGFALRLAWAFVVHLQDRTSILKELFVWPSYRRRGYGQLLEREAAQLARANGSNRLRLWFHRADALVGRRDAGHQFGLGSGYRWNWRRSELPGLDAIGSRAL